MDPAVKKRNKKLFAGSATSSSVEIVYISNSETCGSDRSFFAVTGIDKGHFLYSSVLIYKDGSVKLFVSALEEEEARLSGLPYTVLDPKHSALFEELKNVGMVGVNASAIPLREAQLLRKKRIAFTDISQKISDLRSQKTEHEILNLRNSCKIASKTAGELPSMLKEGMTEKELAMLIDFSMRKKGAESSAFETIAAFGENTAVPHAHPGERRLKKGDLVLCDFGCLKGKMSSDITRVYCFGKAERWQKDLYNKINSIRKNSIEKIAVGKNGKLIHIDAEKEVIKYFDKMNYKGGMNHSLGHSIGYYTHDGKRLGITDYNIPSNFAVTVEPAGYIPGLGGIRLEDDILVLKDRVEVLTDAIPARLKEV